MTAPFTWKVEDFRLTRVWSGSAETEVAAKRAAFDRVADLGRGPRSVSVTVFRSDGLGGWFGRAKPRDTKSLHWEKWAVRS